MSAWTTRLLGEPLPHPITAGIRRVEGRRELQVSGPLGYVRLDDAAIDDLAALIAGWPGQRLPGEAERERMLRGEVN